MTRKELLKAIQALGIEHFVNAESDNLITVRFWVDVEKGKK